MPITMASNTTPVPFVASASNETDPDHFAWRAFDQDKNFEWMGGGGSPWWLGFDWGPAAHRVVSRYVVKEQAFFANLFPQRTPFAWELQGSDDGLVWDTIDTVTGQTSWISQQVRIFDCDVLTPYRYHRMYITLNNGDPTYCLVTDLDLGGGEPDKFY